MVPYVTVWYHTKVIKIYHTARHGVERLLQLVEEVTILADNNELRRHVGVLQSTDFTRYGGQFRGAAPALLLGSSVVLA